MSPLADRRTAISSVIQPQGLKSSQKGSMSLKTVSQSFRHSPVEEGDRQQVTVVHSDAYCLMTNRSTEQVRRWPPALWMLSSYG